MSASSSSFNSNNSGEAGVLVLKFDHVSEQRSGFILRVNGLVKVRNLIPLITGMGLEANPRDSKVGVVTDAIIDSLESSPELFAFKTKGLLVGASSYKSLERSRYELVFNDPEIEGILDGGHNTLAIGLYILRLAMDEGDLPKLSKVKVWAEFKTLWEDNLGNIAAYRAGLKEDDKELDILVPVELILPTDPQEPVIVDAFNKSLFDICTARNNNVQLSQETKANAVGYFDNLKEVLPKDISDRVKWRQNETGDIAPADIVALAWIALSVIPNSFTDSRGRSVEAPSPTQIYSGKAECVARFERLMSSPEVTSKGAGAKRELRNPVVLSALKVAADVPALFDMIYEQFPDLYNANGGSFRRIVAVKKLNMGKAPKFTRFTRKSIKDKIPEGFIVPLVFGLKALIEIRTDGTLGWKVEPREFLSEHLKEIVLSYMDMISALDWDPQKVGKAPASYSNAFTAFRVELAEAKV